jgi:hypothetical protein
MPSLPCVDNRIVDVWSFQFSMLRPPSHQTLINAILWNIEYSFGWEVERTLAWAKVPPNRGRKIHHHHRNTGIASHRVEANSNLLTQDSYLLASIVRPHTSTTALAVVRRKRPGRPECVSGRPWAIQILEGVNGLAVKLGIHRRPVGAQYYY